VVYLPEVRTLGAKDGGGYGGAMRIGGGEVKSFVSCDPPSQEGQTNTWFTPRPFTDALGPFDLDPCTQSFRPHDTAVRHICQDLGQCGLSAPWAGRVWLNPPYGREIGKWISKLAGHSDGIALVFARTDTVWARLIFERSHAVNFVKGRASFIRQSGEPAGNAGTGSMLAAFGASNVECLARIPGAIIRLR